jgi:CheY-like chemotaxis protein
VFLLTRPAHGRISVIVSAFGFGIVLAPPVTVNAVRPTTSTPIETLGPSKRELRTMMVVSRDPGLTLPDSVMDAPDCDVVLIEPLAHAYSRIKHVRPDLVIICVSFDDPLGFQVLSMLKLDPDTAPIRVLTYAATSAELFTEDAVGVDEAALPSQSTVHAALN